MFFFFNFKKKKGKKRDSYNMTSVTHFNKGEDSPVLSGIEAWSVCRSFLNLMLPSWSTEATTFNMPALETQTALWTCSSHAISPLRKHIKAKLHLFVRPLVYPWSSWRPWSLWTGPCPAAQGLSRCHWKGSGSRCSFPEGAPLQGRTPKAEMMNWE